MKSLHLVQNDTKISNLCQSKLHRAQSYPKIGLRSSRPHRNIGHQVSSQHSLAAVLALNSPISLHLFYVFCEGVLPHVLQSSTASSPIFWSPITRDAGLLDGGIRKTCLMYLHLCSATSPYQSVA